MKTISTSEFNEIRDQLYVMVRQTSLNIVLGALAEVCRDISEKNDMSRPWLNLGIKIITLTKLRDLKAIS
jgi:hypothetical protein